MLIFPPKTKILPCVHVPTTEAAFKISVISGRQLPGLHQPPPEHTICQRVQWGHAQWAKIGKYFHNFNSRVKAFIPESGSSFPLYLSPPPTPPSLHIFVSFPFFHYMRTDVFLVIVSYVIYIIFCPVPCTFKAYLKVCYNWTCPLSSSIKPTV